MGEPKIIDKHCETYQCSGLLLILPIPSPPTSLVEGIIKFISNDWLNHIVILGKTFPKLRSLQSPHLHVSCHVDFRVTWSRRTRTCVFKHKAVTTTLWCGMKTIWYVWQRTATKFQGISATIFNAVVWSKRRPKTIDNQRNSQENTFNFVISIVPPGPTFTNIV